MTASSWSCRNASMRAFDLERAGGKAARPATMAVVFVVDPAMRLAGAVVRNSITSVWSFAAQGRAVGHAPSRPPTCCWLRLLSEAEPASQLAVLAAVQGAHSPASSKSSGRPLVAPGSGGERVNRHDLIEFRIGPQRGVKPRPAPPCSVCVLVAGSPSRDRVDSWCAAQTWLRCTSTAPAGRAC